MTSHVSAWSFQLVEENRTTRVTTYAVAQSIAEVSLGSLVHSLRIPLGGHLLSLNQALILTFAVKPESRRLNGARLTCSIGNVAALLKSLSPAGKKLSPMVAIAMQGLLYSAGIALLGVNLLGAVIASALLSLWAFVHPLLSAYVIFGSELFAAIRKLWTDLCGALGIDPAWGIWVLASLVGLKLVIAAGIAISAWVASEATEARYFSKVEELRRKVAPRKPSTPATPPPTPMKGALKDLLHPLFVVSFAVSAGFFLLGKNASASEAILYVLRVIAVGWLFFWVVRKVSLHASFPSLAAIYPSSGHFDAAGIKKESDTFSGPGPESAQPRC